MRRLLVLATAAAGLLAVAAVLYAATAERLLPVQPLRPDLLREQLAGVASAAARFAGLA